MTVYIPDELYEEVKADPELNASAVCQAALRKELERRQGMERIVLFDASRNAPVAFRGRKLKGIGANRQQHASKVIHARRNAMLAEAQRRQKALGGVGAQTSNDTRQLLAQQLDQLKHETRAEIALAQSTEIYLTAKGKFAIYDVSLQTLEVFDGLADLYGRFPASFVKAVADLLGDDAPPDPNIIELDI